MSDFAQAFAQSPVIQPFSGYQQYRQNALQDREIEDREARTNILQQQLNLGERQHQLQAERQQALLQEQAMEIGWKAQQQKAAQVGQIAQRLSGIRDPQERARAYSELRKFVGSPLAVDPVFGELGVGNTDILLSEEAWARMTPVEQDHYLSKFVYSADVIGRMSLQDQDFQHKLNLMKNNFEFDLKREEARRVTEEMKYSLAGKLADRQKKKKWVAYKVPGKEGPVWQEAEEMPPEGATIWKEPMTRDQAMDSAIKLLQDSEYYWDLTEDEKVEAVNSSTRALMRGKVPNLGSILKKKPGKEESEPEDENPWSKWDY